VEVVVTTKNSICPLSFGKTARATILIHVTCYTASLYAIHFKRAFSIFARGTAVATRNRAIFGAHRIGEAQLMNRAEMRAIRIPDYEPIPSHRRATRFNGPADVTSR